MQKKHISQHSGAIDYSTCNDSITVHLFRCSNSYISFEFPFISFLIDTFNKKSQPNFWMFQIFSKCYNIQIFIQQILNSHTVVRDSDILTCFKHSNLSSSVTFSERHSTDTLKYFWCMFWNVLHSVKPEMQFSSQLLVTQYNCMVSKNCQMLTPPLTSSHTEQTSSLVTRFPKKVLSTWAWRDSLFTGPVLAHRASSKDTGKTTKL